MDDLFNICCICVKPNDGLQHLHSSSVDNITYYEKLKTSFTDMCLDEKSAEYKICNQCCADINSVYEFHKKCLLGKEEFALLEAQLLSATSAETKYIINKTNTNATIHDENSLSLNVNEIVETEIQIKCEENNDSNLENNDSNLEYNYLDTSSEAVYEENRDTATTLCSKSKKKYELVYNRFKDWLEKKNLKDVDETTVLTYFTEKSKTLKSSTLWSEYSMLKATLTIKEDINIQQFPRVRAFLKHKSVGYRPQTSEVFTLEQFYKFIEEAPDEKYLMMKMTGKKQKRRTMAEGNKKYTRFKYSEEALFEAVRAIKENQISLNKASKKYSIPKSTLSNKVNEKVVMERKMGPSTILSKEEEEILSKGIIKKAKNGFPLVVDDLKDSIQNILEDCPRPNPFRGNRPGNKWMSLFLKRHPEIKKRNAELQKMKEDRNRNKTNKKKTIVKNSIKKKSAKRGYNIPPNHETTETLKCPESNEDYEYPPDEDWIQCSKCLIWWPESYSFYDGMGEYVCISC